MNPSDIPPGSELDEKAQAVIDVFREYREYIKRNHRELLGGVIWICSGVSELLIYSEGNAKYNQRLTDAIKDITDHP